MQVAGQAVSNQMSRPACSRIRTTVSDFLNFIPR